MSWVSKQVVIEYWNVAVPNADPLDAKCGSRSCSNRNAMDLEDLRTFVEVADTGGVAPGARRLGVSKSIVSRRLARLEEALGVQLLSRTTRGSGLTEAGTTFREHATRIMAEIDTAQETLSQEGEIRGLLRVAAPLSFGTSRLAPVFAELARRHPLLQVET